MKFTRIKTEGLHNVVRLPRLGKIRLGIRVKKANGTEYPKETDYFVCPPEVQAKFGERPTRLAAMLATENEEQNYRQYYAVYGSNQRLKCQGDGQDAERRNDNGEIEKIACPSPEFCDYGRVNKCHERFDLMVVIPDVSVGGVYQVSTGSIAADIDIRSGIEMARSLYGRISWVPLELVREPVRMPEPGTTRMQTHYIVRMRPIGNLETVMAVRKDHSLIPTQETARYLLPEPVIEGPEPDSPIVSEIKEQEQSPPAPIAMQEQKDSDLKSMLRSVMADIQKITSQTETEILKQFSAASKETGSEKKIITARNIDHLMKSKAWAMDCYQKMAAWLKANTPPEEIETTEQEEPVINEESPFVDRDFAEELRSASSVDEIEAIWDAVEASKPKGPEKVRLMRIRDQREIEIRKSSQGVINV